jgi:hypothetical protein
MFPSISGTSQVHLGDVPEYPRDVPVYPRDVPEYLRDVPVYLRDTSGMSQCILGISRVYLKRII